MVEFFTITVIGLAMSMVVMIFGFLQQPRKRLPIKHETSHLIRERHAALVPPQRLAYSSSPCMLTDTPMTQI